MKLDRMDHPASHRAAQVAALCLLGYVGFYMAVTIVKQPARQPAMWIAGGVLTTVFVCALITYFRPRGLPAAITATASFGIYAIFAVSCGGSILQRFSGLPTAIVYLLVALVIVAWLFLGVKYTREEFGRRRG